MIEVFSMEKNVETIFATRKMFIKLMDGLSIEKLNKVPQGFNNNIIWNFGHVIMTQQILCYKLANLSTHVTESYITKYSKGSKPESFIDANELDYLRELALSSVDQLIIDMSNNLFDNFNTYTTSFGVDLTCIDDAVKFMCMHEGMHIGYAMALKRVVN